MARLCKIYLVLTSFFFPIKLSSGIETKNLKFSSRLEGHVLSSLPGLSVTGCWKACKDRQNCKSVNYQRNFHMCEFNSKTLDVVADIKLTTVKGWVYYHDSEEEQCSNKEQTGICDVQECIAPKIDHGKVIGNILTVGSKVRVDCNEGFMTSSGPNIAAVAECTTDGIFTPIHCFPVTCIKIAETRLKVAGVYKSYDSGSGKIVDIFCDYILGSNRGYTFLSKNTLDHVTSLSTHYNRLDHVIIRHYRTDVNQQYSSKLAVLSTHRNQYPNVSLFLSEYPDFNQPKQYLHIPYVQIGFVPISFGDHRNTIQGYNCNGQDNTFKNSDGNPNNNFIFYQNTDSSIPKGNCIMCNSNIMTSWRTCGTTVNSSHNIPVAYFYDTYEIHMGGGGGLAESSISGVGGVIFGFLFEYI